MQAQSKESQAALTPQGALDLLKSGNQRYQDGEKAERNLMEQVKTTATGQFPFAVILSCIDSRVSAELAFDQGVGDIFSVRIAGNIVNGDILGSMEFACKLAGAKLVVVLGHTKCGAVGGACDGAELGNLTGLLSKIQPIVEGVRKTGDFERPELVQKVAESNVDHVVREIRESSPVLEAMISSGSVGIVGAMYSVDSGKVDFQELQVG